MSRVSLECVNRIIKYIMLSEMLYKHWQNSNGIVMLWQLSEFNINSTR